MQDFQNRVVAVTGGGRGIGAATCERFARGAARVAVIDRDIEPAEQTAHSIQESGASAARAFGCDVTIRDEVETTVESIVKEFGALDCLVCCAGIVRDNLIHKMNDEDWNAVLSTHLTGSFLIAQAAQRHMVPRRYGKIVFLSSTSALGNRGQANYSVAKAGMQGLTKTLAIELGQFNINVNAVAPGFIETRMTQATAERVRIPWDEFKQMAAGRTALKRVGRPRDVANVIAFLCTDDASFVTGQVVYVRGGP